MDEEEEKKVERCWGSSLISKKICEKKFRRLAERMSAFYIWLAQALTAKSAP